MKIEKVYVRLGAKIRLLRTAQWMTQEQLAGRLKISRGGLVNIELGRQRVMIHDCYKIAGVLGVSLKKFLKGVF